MRKMRILLHITGHNSSWTQVGIPCVARVNKSMKLMCHMNHHGYTNTATLCGQNSCGALHTQHYLWCSRNSNLPKAHTPRIWLPKRSENSTHNTLSLSA
jgi:hypothetical protein